MGRALKAAALLGLLATAAAVSAAERITETRSSHTLDHKTTDKRKYYLPVPDGARRVRLRLKALVREGEIKLVVRDAGGRVLQDARLAPAKTKPNAYDVDSGEVKAAAGVWTIEVELKDALGRYEYTWTADVGD